VQGVEEENYGNSSEVASPMVNRIRPTRPHTFINI